MLACIVSISAAIMTCSGQSWPVLVGSHTPQGSFVARRMVQEPDSFGFNVDESGSVFAVHPVRSTVRRMALRKTANFRKIITNGCINVSEETADNLPSTFALEVIK